MVYMAHALGRPVVLCLTKIDGDPNYKHLIKQDRGNETLMQEAGLPLDPCRCLL